MNGKIVALFLVVLCCAIMHQAVAEIGPQCLMPLVPGPCRAMMLRYGYNPETNQCEQFMYGGCQGNANNFASMDLCKGSCS